MHGNAQANAGQREQTRKRRMNHTHPAFLVSNKTCQTLRAFNRLRDTLPRVSSSCTRSAREQMRPGGKSLAKSGLQGIIECRSRRTCPAKSDRRPSAPTLSHKRTWQSRTATSQIFRLNVAHMKPAAAPAASARLFNRPHEEHIVRRLEQQLARRRLARGHANHGRRAALMQRLGRHVDLAARHRFEKIDAR